MKDSRIWIPVLLAAALIVGCGRGSGPSLPAGPSSAVSPASSASLFTSKAGKSIRTISIFDACDPETFNARLGDGACIRSGGMKFDTFFAILSRQHFVGPWHFAPDHISIGEGETFAAMNGGGETHTFTEVEEYGGGISQEINDAGGFGAEIPECQALHPGDFLHPGDTFEDTPDEKGVEKYQCCIHPWMRAEIHIGDSK